jgi:hypothetical protein
MENPNCKTLEELERKFRAKSEFYRDAKEDPHNINTGLYIAMLEIANTLREMQH